MLACTCRHCHSQHCSEDEGECEGVPVQQVSPRLHSGGRYTAVLCHPPATEVRPSLCWHCVNCHCADTLSTVTWSHSVNCHVLFWHSVHCHCSGTLATFTLSTVTCSDSLSTTEFVVALDLSSVKLLHGLLRLLTLFNCNLSNSLSTVPFSVTVSCYRSLSLSSTACPLPISSSASLFATTSK